MALVPLSAQLDGPPPHNAEAERAVLGAILIDARNLDRVQPIVKEHDFFGERHQAIFATMCAMAEAGGQIDIVTLRDELRRTKRLTQAGGTAYVASLTDPVPDIANVERWAEIVREQAMLRSLMYVGRDVVRDAADASDRSLHIVSNAEKKMLEIANRGAQGGLRPMKELTSAAVAWAEEQHAAQGRPTGLITGYVDLDRLTGGLQRQDLIIIAARPAMGKTSFMLNLAEGIAVPRQGERATANVAIFSLEMSNIQLAMRLLSSQALINGRVIRGGLLTPEQWSALAAAGARLAASGIWIDDTPGIDLSMIRARARQLQRSHGLDLVMVDYLQLMAQKEKTESRNVEIAQISRGLKILAKELNVPVIALSQLSRRPEQRKGDHRPQTADLRDSGSIEQDADIVMFIYRDEEYDDNSPDKGIAEIIVAKHRNGPTDTIRLVFRNDITKFFNFEREPEPPMPAPPPSPPEPSPLSIEFGS